MNNTISKKIKSKTRRTLYIIALFQYYYIYNILLRMYLLYGSVEEIESEDKSKMFADFLKESGADFNLDLMDPNRTKPYLTAAVYFITK